LENIFPMVGKNARIFPMIGKIFREFSNDWKKSFQWLENFGSSVNVPEPPFQSHGGKEQGGRQDTPSSVRGVARPWSGCPCMEKDKCQGPRRGEYCGRPSRQAQLHTAALSNLLACLSST
jgi:hypothetical protein